tara:strand:+ start:359 stop:532 length:174 start_codon:yes stop_codon:yes gene_type:complete
MLNTKTCDNKFNGYCKENSLDLKNDDKIEHCHKSVDGTVNGKYFDDKFECILKLQIL